MREIKFRAWAGNVMVFFDLFSITNTEADTRFQCIHSPHMSVSYKCPIMQYTGLKDKNRVEIYEGDIIKTPLGDMAKVIWDDAGAFFVPEFSGGRRCASFISYHPWLCEVIGNIYANPELLEASK